MRTPTSRATPRLALGGVVLATLAACAAGTGGPEGPSTPAGGANASAPTAASSPPTPTVTPPSTTPTTTPPPGTPAPTGSCATRVRQGLTTAQKVGQLLMVGIQPSEAPSGLDGVITGQHLGGVVYLGGWNGAQTVTSTSAHLQRATGLRGVGDVGLLVAADQEGGQVQQLKGPGFSSLQSALALGARSASAITAVGTLVGRELHAAGVDVDLAPVADTVPASLGRGNGPIGRYDRQFGADPTTVGRAVSAFTTGLRSSGVVATVKHFPGIGRITSNTDTSSTGINDATTTATDAYLHPFVAGMRAGAGMVMVSSARYPRIDPQNQAVFSRPIITDLLRGRLGWKGVVVTDDVGVARAVRAVPVGERATRFVDAGGDIVLTASAATVPVMAGALATRYAADPAFATEVEAAVARVLALKQGLGLLACG